MKNAGKSILWFLGSCLLFSQSLIGVLNNYSDAINTIYLAYGFGFLSLIIVLGTLLYMFKLDPAFITAEKGDMVPLAIVRQLSSNVNPILLKTLIETIPAGIWSRGEDVVDSDEDEEIQEDDLIEEELNDDEGDALDYSEFLKKINKD